MIINIHHLTKDRSHSVIGSIFGPFSIVSVWNRFFVVIGLFISSVIEMLGLAIVIPLLASISSDVDRSGSLSGNKAALASAFGNLFNYLGLPNNIATMILFLVLGLSMKSAITISIMRHVGHLMAEMTTSVRMAIIRSLLDANWHFFSAQSLGRLTNAAGTEAGAVGESFLCSSMLIAVSLQALAYAVIASFVSWKLALVAIVICMIMLITFGRLIKMTRNAAKEHTRQMRQMASSFTDSILGMKPIKAMGRQARFASLFEADAKKLDATLRTRVVSGEFAGELQEPLIAALLCVGLYLATAWWHVQLHQQIVIGLLLVRLITAFSLAQRTYQRLISMQEMYNSVGKLVQSATTAREIYTGRVLPTFEQGIEFRNVSFGYTSEDQVLKDANWHLPVGKIYALVGASGVGKSTVVDLIIGLRQPANGNIFLDGVNLEDIDITAWRHMIGYVPQEVVLFNDTIYNNVTLGEPDFTEADVAEALSAAGASSFVQALPNGVDYEVGERGHRLSGGQRQRIAIARALVRRPSMLILDEATTGLDRAVEQEICDAIQDLVHSRKITVLAISHQPTWSSMADIVYSMHRRTLVSREQEVDVSPRGAQLG